MNKFAKRGVAFATLLILIITLFSVNVFASDNLQFVRQELIWEDDYYYCSLEKQYEHFGENAKIYINVIPNDDSEIFGCCLAVGDNNGYEDYIYVNEGEQFLVACFSGLTTCDPTIKPFYIYEQAGVESFEVYVMAEDVIPDTPKPENSITHIFNIVFHDMPIGFKNSLQGFIYNGEPNFSLIAVHGFEWFAFALALSVFVALIISITDTLRRK